MEHKPFSFVFQSALDAFFRLLGFGHEEISPGRSINKHQRQLFARGYRGGRCAQEL